MFFWRGGFVAAWSVVHWKIDGVFDVNLLGVRIKSFLILPKRMLFVLRRSGMPLGHVLKDKRFLVSKFDVTFLVAGKADIVSVRKMRRPAVSLGDAIGV